MFASVDKPFFYSTLVLAVGGMLILASASLAISYQNFGTIHYYLFRQFLYGGLTGVVALLAFFAIPYRFWKKAAVPLMMISFLLLALLFMPGLGYSAGGARRWLQFGPLTFQPAEILKFSFIIYLASWLDSRRQEVKSISYGMIPLAIMLGSIAV